MTQNEKNNIRETLRDWETSILRRREYPQILICMKSPTEMVIYRIPTLADNSKVLQYLEILIEQLKATQN